MIARYFAVTVSKISQLLVLQDYYRHIVIFLVGALHSITYILKVSSFLPS